MATLGEQLKAARKAKGVTESEAGSATRVLRQIITAMENDDFSEMPAPTYAKGFIRLYAEYLGLDPEPLVAEYLEKHAQQTKPLVDENSQLEQNARTDRPSTFDLAAKINLGSWLSKARTGGLLRMLKRTPLRDIRVLAAAIAGLLVLIVLIVSISNCSRRRAAAQPAPGPAPVSAHLLISEPAPDIYLVEPGKIESK
jgi:transcriptional regulator with XRE-family HTH domain